MTADDGAIDFARLLETAAQNLGDGFRRNEAFWKSHKIQRGDRSSAHCENIGKCICGGDLSVRERVINNRRKEIRRLHERALSIQAIDTGVVERARVHEDVAISISR